MLDQYKIKFCIICLVSFSVISFLVKPVYGQTSDFFMTIYNSSKVNGSQLNRCVTQSAQGDLLFANLKGLLTFNGKYWKLRSAKNHQNDVIKFSNLYPASSTKIYAGSSYDIGYWEVNNEQYQYVSLLKKQERKEERNTITQIVPYKKWVFFLSFQKIFVTDGKKLIKTLETDRTHQFAYLHIVQDQLYLSKFGSVELWDNAQQTFVPKIQHKFGEVTGGRGALSILLSNHRQQLMSLFFKQGIWTKSGSKPFRKLKFPAEVEVVFKEGVRRACKYNQNTILFSTFNKVYLLDLVTQKLTKVFQDSGLIRDFFIDKNNNIWLTNHDKIVQIEISSNLKYYLKDTDVWWALSNQDGVFLGGIGKQAHLYWLNSSQEFIPLDIKKPVKVLCTVGEDKLLAGTSTELFLVDYRNKQITKVFSSSGIYRVVADYQNFVYVSFRGKIQVFQLVNDQLNEIGEIKNEKGKLAISILRKKNELWLGFNESGIACYQVNEGKTITFDKKQAYSTKDGDFKGNDKEFNIQLRKNKIIAHNHSGIYEFDNETRKFTKLQIQGMDAHQQSYAYWLTSEKDRMYATGKYNQPASFGIVQKKGEKYTWNPTPFLRLPALEMRGLLSHQQKLFAATSKGLLVYEPQKKKDYNFHYPTRIKATVDTNQITPDTTLAYHSRQLTFNYLNPFFEVPEQLQYAYQLIGFKDEWSAWSTETKKEYTNLREGNYTFRVKAKNVHGKVSEVSNYSFTIAPPWYRTTWAYAGYVVFGFLFMAGAIRINGYRLRKQKQRLEVEVARQTQEITEQNEEIAQQAEELKTSNEKLAELSNFRESLSHMLVHDAKQPLTPLINSDQPHVKRAAQRVLGMLENILEVQKFESNEVIITHEPISMKDLIASVIDQVKDLADEKLINIKNSIPLQAVVSVDASYISRVFTNLLGNAIKYVPANAVVQLAAEEMPQNNQLKIWIKDNGPGIPDQHKKSIFDKFGRIDKKDQRSTGLGLAFCKLAVEAHEGEIGVLTISETQALGASGAWFYFTLPLISNKNADLSPTPATVLHEQNLIDQAFTQQDHELIKDFIPQLAEIDFYEAGKIMILLQNRDWVGSPALEAWIEQIPFTNDAQHYQQMLGMFR